MRERHLIDVSERGIENIGESMRQIGDADNGRDDSHDLTCDGQGILKGGFGHNGDNCRNHLTEKFLGGVVRKVFRQSEAEICSRCPGSPDGVPVLNVGRNEGCEFGRR